MCTCSICIRVCVCECMNARAQYNERILFQQKGTSRWYTQSTPIHHHRRASGVSSAFPTAPPLIANRTLVCFICLYTKPNRIIITYARALHYYRRPLPYVLCASIYVYERRPRSREKIKISRARSFPRPTQNVSVCQRIRHAI